MSDLTKQIAELREPVAYGPVGSQKARDNAADTIERLQAELEKVRRANYHFTIAEKNWTEENERLREALEKVLNHWPNDPDDYADGVQKIAREALKGFESE